MLNAVYKSAVNDLVIKQLSDFLKSVEDMVEIEEWSKIKAPEKRTQFLDMLAMDGAAPIREKFVAFYNEQTGKTGTFAEWESDAPTPDADPVGDEGDATPEPDPAPSKATKNLPMNPADLPVMSAPGVFVEGAFETMKSDAAGLDAEHSTQALRAAEEDLEFNHLRIGVLLSHIQRSEHYQTAGFSNMREYLAANTSLGYRKAMQLAQNATVVEELGISEEELKGVTWAALRHVLPVLTKKNHKKWLKMAANTKHLALVEAVNTEKVKQAGGQQKATKSGDGGEAGPQASNKVFNLLPDQKQSVENALEKAKVAGNTDSNAAALEIIAAAYAGSPLSESTLSGQLPDLSDDGLLNALTKIRADEGMDGFVRLMNLIEKVWPEPVVEVSFPEQDAA